MKVTIIARPWLAEQWHHLEQIQRCRDDQMEASCAQALVETAGRVCYDSFGTGRNSQDFAANILEQDHGSVLEHAQFSFLIENVSRNFSHELVRHRVGIAVSQRSTRFVDEAGAKMATLHLQPVKPTTKRLMQMAETSSKAAYRALVEDLTEQGYDRKAARGAAARYLLNGVSTQIVWSANVRTLRHVITMRGAAAADIEMRVFSCRLLDIMRTELPCYFDDLPEIP